MKEHQPSTHQDVKDLTPLLQDFGALWSQMTLAEKKALLRVMFVALYFDEQGKIRKVAAKQPFDRID